MGPSVPFCAPPAPSTVPSSPSSPIANSDNAVPPSHAQGASTGPLWVVMDVQLELSMAGHCDLSPECGLPPSPGLSALYHFFKDDSDQSNLEAFLRDPSDSPSTSALPARLASTSSGGASRLTTDTQSLQHASSAPCHGRRQAPPINRVESLQRFVVAQQPLPDACAAAAAAPAPRQQAMSRPRAQLRLPTLLPHAMVHDATAAAAAAAPAVFDPNIYEFAAPAAPTAHLAGVPFCAGPIGAAPGSFSGVRTPADAAAVAEADVRGRAAAEAAAAALAAAVTYRVPLPALEALATNMSTGLPPMTSPATTGGPGPGTVLADETAAAAAAVRWGGRRKRGSPDDAEAAAADNKRLCGEAAKLRSMVAHLQDFRKQVRLKGLGEG